MGQRRSPVARAVCVLAREHGGAAARAKFLEAFRVAGEHGDLVDDGRRIGLGFLVRMEVVLREHDAFDEGLDGQRVLRGGVEHDM